MAAFTVIVPPAMFSTLLSAFNAAFKVREAPALLVNEANFVPAALTVTSPLFVKLPVTLRALSMTTLPPA